MTTRPQDLHAYYADPAVRTRILEYCGGSREHPPTAVFLAGITGGEGSICSWDQAPRTAVANLDALLDAGADIARSAWDREALLIHFDFDYQNIDVPGEAYHHPAEVFWKLEPVYRAAQHVLRRYGLRLLPLMTGRGYHLTGRVPLAADVVDRLAALVPGPPAWLATMGARPLEGVSDTVTERHARAYTGASMVTEFLAHAMMRRADARSPIPTVLNNVIVGSGLTGRECNSIDLSYAGDPMDIRHMRVAFGAYQKHRFRPDLVAHRAASERPPFIAVPRGRESLQHLLTHGRDFAHAARAARSRPTALPDVTGGARSLLDAYDRSDLAAFHRAFYATPQLTIDESDEQFRALCASSIPPCVLQPLLGANDLLLQPTCVQHVTRGLMAEGIPARDIAGIVRARYAADLGWGSRWSWMDRESRAEFDVRVFAAALAVGADRAVDFNCVSAQQKGLCTGGPCCRDLRDNRSRLLEAVAA